MSESKNKLSVNISSGIGFGVCLAIVISYTANQSIGWAILHGIFGWGYVLYILVTGTP